MCLAKDDHETFNDNGSEVISKINQNLGEIQQTISEETIFRLKELSKNLFSQDELGKREQSIDEVWTLVMEIVEEAVSIVCHLTNTKNGSTKMLECNGLPNVVNLLPCTSGKVLLSSTKILANLLEHSSQVSQKVNISKIVPLLKLVYDMNTVIDHIRALPIHILNIELQMFSSGGTARLLAIMHRTDVCEEELLWTTARALSLLSVCEINKLTILRANGLGILSRHVKARQSDRLIEALDKHQGRGYENA
jgi:hypothetical protein